MKVSASGRDRIATREGRRLKAYEDSAGVWTIGVGHTGRMSPPAVTVGMIITPEQSDEFLAADLAPVEAAVNAIGVSLTQNQFDALASLAFNIGVHGFTGSTVVRDLKRGDVRGAADAFRMWEKPPELRSRRESERAQFLTPDGANAPVEAKPAPTSQPSLAEADPIGAFFQDLGGLFANHFGDALARVLTPPPPQAAPQAAETGQSAGLDISSMLKVAEFFLANVKTFGAYATVLPHIATEIPDIVAKSKQAEQGVEKIVADIRAGQFGAAANDFQAVFVAVEGVLTDVGIPLGHITSVADLSPKLPSVEGIKAIPSPKAA